MTGAGLSEEPVSFSMLTIVDAVMLGEEEAMLGKGDIPSRQQAQSRTRTATPLSAAAGVDPT